MAKNKKELIAEAIELGIKLTGDEKNAEIALLIANFVKEEETENTVIEEIKDYNADELCVESIKIETPQEKVDRLALEIYNIKTDIAKKENRNISLKQQNKNRNEEIEHIKSISKTSISDENLKLINNKKLEIKENNRQIDNNIIELESLNKTLFDIDKEYMIALPILTSHKAIEFLNIKNKKELITDEIITFIENTLIKEKELAKAELLAKGELNKLLNKYDVGDISNEFYKLEKEYGIVKSKVNNKIRGYIKEYSRRILPFARKLK